MEEEDRRLGAHQFGLDALGPSKERKKNANATRW